MSDYSVVESIFLKAAEQKTPAELSEFLDANCEDAGIRREVERLLSADPKVGDFLSAPAVPADVTVDRPAEGGPGTLIGPYKLMEQIGEGGFGLVYVAEQHRPMRRKVALKIIKPGMDSRNVIARFEAERQALALMDHPNIARVLDAGTTEQGRPFFVMELVKGISIVEYCDARRLDTRERLKLFATVCQAVQHAHAKGVIHRDLKPSNIMVAPHDGKPVVKVIDFGIAKAIGQQLTEKTVYTNFAQIIGTPLYMSPEQAELNALDIDTRSDIYSLGVLLYQLLTGTTPFDKERFASAAFDEMRRIIREEDPPKPSTRLTSLGEAISTVSTNHGADPTQLSRLIRGDLDWIVMKALEKDRARRYETASSFADDVRRFLDDQEVAARPASTAYRLQKFARRNKGLLGTAIAFACVLMLATIISAWSAHVASVERQRSETSANSARKAKAVAIVAANRADAEARRARQNEELARWQHYVASMTLAPVDWERANFDRLRKSLEATENYADRHFEWFYWLRQLHRGSLTFREQPDILRAIAVSPNGDKVATGSDNRTIKVWNAQTGEVLLTLWHENWVHTLTFSPQGDRLLSASDDHTARIWDVSTGAELLVINGHQGNIKMATYSPDGRRILTCGTDNTAKLWDATTGKLISTFEGQHQKARFGVWTAVFSRDGKRIATGAFNDGYVVIWNLDGSVYRRIKVAKNDDAVVHGIDFSPDGAQIVVADWSTGETARIWDVETGDTVRVFRGHQQGIADVKFSNDGLRLLTGSLDHTARLWDVQTGAELRAFVGHAHNVWRVAWFPDGERIATASWDGTAKIWNTDANRHNLPFADTHAVAFLPDGRTAVLGGSIESETEANNADTEEGVRRRGVVRLVNVQTKKELRQFTGHEGPVRDVAVFPDGRRIASCSDDGTVRVWDLDSNKSQVLVGHKAAVNAVDVSQDGQWLVSGSNDRTAIVWEVATGKSSRVFDDHIAAVKAVAISPDGRQIATGGEDTRIRTWHVDTGKVEHVLETDMVGPECFDYSPDGSLLAMGAWNKHNEPGCIVWDSRTGKRRFSCDGMLKPVHTVAFSADGTRLVTGCADQTLRLWDTRTGLQLLSLPLRNRLRSVAFTADNRYLLAATWSGETELFQAATRDEVEVWRNELRQVPNQEPRYRPEELLAGTIREWLVLGPLVLPDVSSEELRRLTNEAVVSEQLKNESHLQPRDGQRETFAGTDFVWKATTSPTELTDFSIPLETNADRGIAYAVAYVTCDEEHAGLRMRVSGGMKSRIYVNEKLCYSTIAQNHYAFHTSLAPSVDLKRGVNTVIFKTVNDRAKAWVGSICFIDARGEIVPIRTTLVPPTTDREVPNPSEE